MRVLIAALVLGCTMFITPVALAEAPPEPDTAASETQEDPAEERATQFVGVTGPEAESIPGGALLLAAYAIVWALLFLFLMRMRGLQRQTAEELERLSAEIRASESA
ncbi:MAG: CcmD family protein [Deltaproteobacteria bacterium]|nr:CcmD family protein [Deltaproteobacteria bacterium]